MRLKCDIQNVVAIISNENCIGEKRSEHHSIFPFVLAYIETIVCVAKYRILKGGINIWPQSYPIYKSIVNSMINSLLPKQTIHSKYYITIILACSQPKAINKANCNIFFWK